MKKSRKEEPVMRIHKVSLGNDLGFQDEITIQTDGTKYEKRCFERLDTYASLSTLVPQLTEILKKHPGATLTEQPKQWDDGNDVVIEWWEPIKEDDPAVERLLANAKEAEERQRKYDEQQLARLKRERPDLFNK